MSAVEFTPQHDRYMRSFAYKVWTRTLKAGAPVAREDIYQELCVAWCRARDGWKPDYGVPFLAYLARGMQNHINRWVQNQITEGKHLPLDMKVHGDDGDGDADLYSAIPDKQESALDTMAREDTRSFALARLSPRARLFVELLSNPPQFLIDAVDQARARTKHGRDTMQIVTLAPRNVTASMVLDFMGADRTERAEIYDDVARVTRIVNRKDQ